MIKHKIYDAVKKLIGDGIELDDAIAMVLDDNQIDDFKEALSEEQVIGLNLNKIKIESKPAISDSRISLRKLTLKSKMDTGRYENWTVAEIIEKNDSYIPWCYYNLERISFADEVMQKLPEWVLDNPINKPGCDRDLWLILRETHYERRRSYKDLSLGQLKNLLTYYRMSNKPAPDALYRAWKSKKVAIEHSNKDNTPSKETLMNKNRKA